MNALLDVSAAIDDAGAEMTAARARYHALVTELRDRAEASLLALETT